MHDNSPQRRGRRSRPAALTAAFVTIAMAIGGVTRLFGTEAGLLVTLLAVVALVVNPHLYADPAAVLPELPVDEQDTGDPTEQDRSTT